MQNFKFILFSIAVLGVLGLLGYWAILTIEPGSVYVEREKQRQLEEQKVALQKEVEELKSQIALSGKTQILKEEPVKESETTSDSVSLKYQSLINDLQKLMDDKVLMREKSRGTRVGTVQTFLNIYYGTDKKVDNNYGAGTKTDMLNFQKAEGLKADGETDPATFLKMIDWLKKNS